MGRKWQLQEAKNHLSEVVELALNEGPQTVTRHGKDVVVIVATDELSRRRRGGRRGTVVSFLRGLHLGETQLDVRRSRDRDRESGI